MTQNTRCFLLFFFLIFLPLSTLAKSVHLAGFTMTAEVECMAKNIYFESRNESIFGKLSVGIVTLNRVKSLRWPNDICSVVYQRLQFSWYWDGKSDTPDLSSKIERHAWMESVLAAIYVIDMKNLPVSDATCYHANYVDPDWAKRSILIRRIETHIFYEC